MLPHSSAGTFKLLAADYDASSEAQADAVEEVVGFAMSVLFALCGRQLDGTVCKAKGGCACQSVVHHSGAGQVNI